MKETHGHMLSSIRSVARKAAEMVSYNRLVQIYCEVKT